MKNLFSPDSHWHDLGEVKYELLFPRRLLLQFLQHDDFPKALSKLECVTYLPFPEQCRTEQAGSTSGGARARWKWQWCHSRGNLLGAHTTMMQQSWPTLPARKRRGQCLLLNPETHPGSRSTIGGYSDWERRGSDWRGSAEPSFGRQPHPAAWCMLPVSKLSLHVQEVISTLETACWEFSIQPSVITFLPTLNFFWPKQICEKIKIIFVASSLFLMERPNAQEMKLLGAGVLTEWVDSNDCPSRKYSFILQVSLMPEQFNGHMMNPSTRKGTQRHVAGDGGCGGISLLAEAFQSNELAVMWRCNLRSSKKISPIKPRS